MKQSQKLLMLLFTLYSVNFFCEKVYALNQDVLITEIMYDGKDADDDHEWVEIYNRGGDPVTIVPGRSAGAWRFFDGAPHILSLFKGESMLAPQAYAILANNPAIFLQDYPVFSGTIFKVSMSLKNEAGTLKLSSDGGKTYFGEVAYSKSQGGAGDGKTLERAATGWQESYILGGTPGKPASEPLPPPVYSNRVVVNEVYPNPKVGEKEFVELYNTGSEIVNLTDWTIDDILSGGSKPFPIPAAATISPGGYLVFLAPIGLNNDGDTVNLIAPGGTVKSSFVYTTSTKGRSWSRKSDSGFSLTRKVTAGLANEFSHAVHSLDVVINEIVPDPATGSQDELIELRNLSQLAIDITDWQIDDSDGGSKPYILPEDTIVPAGGYFILYNSTTGVALNNDGDRARLLWDDGALISEVAYTSAKDNQAYARADQGEFVWTSILTPGSPNEFPAADITYPSAPAREVSSPAIAVLPPAKQILDHDTQIPVEPVEAPPVVIQAPIPEIKAVLSPLPSPAPKKNITIYYPPFAASGMIGILGLMHQWHQRQKAKKKRKQSPKNKSLK